MKLLSNTLVEHDKLKQSNFQVLMKVISQRKSTINYSAVLFGVPESVLPTRLKIYIKKIIFFIYLEIYECWIRSR